MNEEIRDLLIRCHDQLYTKAKAFERMVTIFREMATELEDCHNQMIDLIHDLEQAIEKDIEDYMKEHADGLN